MLNTAEGTTSGTVDTNEKFYKPFGIKYKGLKLLDVSQTNIAIHFNEVADFIDEAVLGGGKDYFDDDVDNDDQDVNDDIDNDDQEVDDDRDE